MPEIDLTITISVILALCSIFSTIITAIINNRQQIKLKRLELKQKEYENSVLHKRKIYENYLENAGRCIYFADAAALKDYGEHYFTALMIAPDELRSQMIQANDFMMKTDGESACRIIEDIIPAIHTILETK